MLTDILSGAASVAIVYNEESSIQMLTLMRNISDMLRANGATNVACISYANKEAAANYDYEILVGVTDREATKEAVELIRYNEYGVAFGENNIAVIGWNEEAALGAETIFAELVDHILAGGKSEDFGMLYKLAVPEIVGDDIPVLDGFDTVTDAGEGAFMILVKESNADAYNAYRAELEAIGYKLHITNTMAGKVLCATYYNDDTVVNLVFAGGDENGDRSLRVVVEPRSNTALPSTEKPEDADATVAVSSITQMAPHNLCLVIQLSNGEFIIVDSGNNGTQKGLYDFLVKKAPNGKPVVAAWIFTHFHQDHIGGFVDFVNNSRFMRDVTIKNIIYNFPQAQVISTAPSVTDQGNVTKWPSRLEKTEATVYQARTGQKYYFGNAEVEILWTYEDIMPFNISMDRSNPTCIGFSVTIAGQKLIVTGDSSAEEFEVAYKRYGDYLKSDYVQLSHHGEGDGGSPREFYEYVNAKYVFNPGKGGCSASEQWACDNALANGGKVFVRDYLGICTVTLPYEGGEFESEKGQ